MLDPKPAYQCPKFAATLPNSTAQRLFFFCLAVALAFGLVSTAAAQSDTSAPIHDDAVALLIDGHVSPLPSTVEPPVEVVEPPVDGARLRWAFAFEGGAFIAPVTIVSDSGEASRDDLVIGVLGLTTELGIQISNFVGLYLTGGADIIFGPFGGIHASMGILTDFTLLNDALTLGLGLDMGGLVGLNLGSDLGATAGAGYGMRLRACWNFSVERSSTEARRSATFVGLDLRLLGGLLLSGSESTGGSGSNFFISPMVLVGWRGF